MYFFGTYIYIHVCNSMYLSSYLHRYCLLHIGIILCVFWKMVGICCWGVEDDDDDDDDEDDDADKL